MAQSLGRKIALGQFIAFFFFLVFSGIVIIYLYNIKNNNIKNLNTNFTHYRLSQKTKLHIVQIQQYLSDIGATRGEDGLDDGLLEAEKNYKLVLSNLAEERELALKSNNQEMVKSLDEIKSLLDVYYQTGVTMANLYIKEGTKSGNAHMPIFDKASLDLQEKVNYFLEQSTNRFMSEIKNIATDLDLLLKLALWIPFFAIIIFSIFSYKFIKNLTSHLIEVVTELNQTAPELIEAADSMNSLSTELSACATEQAAAVQETAASMEEITAMIGRNSDNAHSAKKSSSENVESVRAGQETLKEMLVAIEDINRGNDAFNLFLEKNNQELNEIAQVISNIADKTKVINDIVFQTKLLSFNASVEAARAGEQGKGFSVVAEEIGNLAEMSGNASNEIKVELNESIKKVNGIVSNARVQVENLIATGKSKIEIGIQKSKECEAILNEINNASHSSESLVAEVANASKEQAQGIAEVNKAMGQIDEVTNQNTAASQGVSANAANVMQLSSSVKNSSAKLLQLIKGS